MVYSASLLVLTRMFCGQNGGKGKHNIAVPNQAITEVLSKYNIFIAKLNMMRFSWSVDRNRVLFFESVFAPAYVCKVILAIHARQE